MHPNDLVVHRFGPEDAPRLVLAHGLTEAGTAWPDAVAHWQSDWRIDALDQRGHGLSPRFPRDRLPRALDVFVADLIAHLESLDTPPIIVGHSLGGRVATATALGRPDLVRALVLEDPALADGTVTPPGFLEDILVFLDEFSDGITSEVTRMRSATSWSEAEILEWAACKPLVDRTMVAELDLGELRRADALNALRVPTLLLADADGPLAPAPAEVTNRLVRVEAIEGVSHCVRRDDPETYHALVDPFLAAHL